MRQPPRTPLWSALGFAGVALLAQATAVALWASSTTSNWSVTVSHRRVHDVLAADDGSVWIATDGGVVRWATPEAEPRSLTHLDGLARGEVLALAQDDDGGVWCGTAGGGLSRYDIAEARFEAPLSAFAERQISALAAGEGVLYVGSDRGISVLSLSLGRVLESYRQFGTFGRDAVVRAVAVHDGRLWAATDEGVAGAALDALNLQDPDAWQVAGLGGVRDLVVVADTLWAATTRGTWRWRDATWQPGGGPQAATGLLDASGELVAAAGQRLFRRTPAGWQQEGRLAAASLGGLALVAGRIWAGTENGVYVAGDGPRALGDPPTSRFADLALGADGRLWAASVPNDREGTPSGLYVLDEGGTWQAQGLGDGMDTDIVVSVAVTPAGTVWAGSWGYGVAVGDVGAWRVLDERNSPLRGLVRPTAPSFVVVPDIEVDADGRVWMTNVQAGVVVVDGFPMHRGRLFDAQALGLGPAPYPGPLAIGPTGIKWIGTEQEGLVLLDDNGTPFEAADDVVHGISPTTEPRLTSPDITALAVDGDVLWVGTDDGLHRLVVRYRRPDVTVATWHSYGLLQGLESAVITDIAVDGLGSVWIGTGEGVAQLRTTGAFVHTFTTANSGLVDDRVESLHFDPQTNLLRIGTRGGLSTLRVAGRASLPGASVAVFPNPYNPAGRRPLTFAGLPLEAEVRLFAVDGTRVVRVDAGPEGAATWNGRLENGGLAPSGVYFYVATGPQGQRWRGKVAVVRGARP